MAAIAARCDDAGATAERGDRRGSGGTMSEIRVVCDGRAYEFAAGDSVSIGRAADNDVVVSEPTVSRDHAHLSSGPDGWVLSDGGRGRVFSDGRAVDHLRITAPVDLRLVSPDGPPIHLEPVREVAGASAAVAAVMPAVPAGATHLGTGQELLSAVHVLVPLRSWLTNRGWRTGWRLLLIPYALLPLIFVQLYSNTTNPTTPGWAYALYVAPLWAIAFCVAHPSGPPRPQGADRRGADRRVVLVWMQLVTITINDHLNGTSFGEYLLVGFNEEITKALPVLLVALVIRRARGSRWDVRMWMFLGTIAGLTFGVREASLYTAASVLTVNHHPGLVIVGILDFSYRVFVDGFLHAIWAGIAAFFIGMGVNYSRRRWQLIVFGVVIVALLHALNDWDFNATTVWPQVGVEGFSLLLFLGYTLTAHSIEQRVRQSPVFRGESMLADSFSESAAASSGETG